MWPAISQIVTTPVSIIQYLLQFPQIIKGFQYLSPIIKNELLQLEDKKLVILTRRLIKFMYVCQQKILNSCCYINMHLL